MKLFTSRREQRLWLWVLVVMMAIYSTLGLARSLAGVLRQQGWFSAVFVIAALLVLAAIVTRGLSRRPGAMEVVVVLGVVAAYLLVFVRMAIPEERTHLIEYGVVAILIHEALLERKNNGRSIRFPALLAILITSLLGVLDESIQALLPNRVFDPQDILFNVLAALMAVTVSVALAGARKQTDRWRGI